MLRDEYPPGVPCWIDLLQADPDRTMRFYGDLFDWTFDVRTPAEAPVRYAYARREGATAAGVGGPPGPGDPVGWTTYVRVASADATADAVVAAGGKVLVSPADIPGAGRVSVIADPHGAVIGVWEPAGTAGVELVNAPGSWNFSELHTPDAEAAIRFYGEVFGWVCNRVDLGEAGEAWLWRSEGYAAFLAERDPEFAAAHEAGHIPDGFSDAVAWMEPFDAGDEAATSWWSVTFAVADADAAFARAVELGAEEVRPLGDTAYTRQSSVRDPQGAVLTLSEYRPPAD